MDVEMLTLVAMVFGPGGIVFVMMNGMKETMKRVEKNQAKILENDATQDARIDLVEYRVEKLEE